MATKVLLKFADDDIVYKCEVQKMSEHRVRVSGLLQDTSGFVIYADSNSSIIIGDYSNFIYEYANPDLDENVYEYTDNNAVYPNEGAEKEKSIKERLSELETTVSTLSSTINTMQTTISELQTKVNELSSTTTEE